MWENLSPVSQELTLNPMQCFYWYFIAPSVKSCQKIFTPARIKGYFLYQTTVTFQTFSLVSSAARLLSQPLWGEIVFYSMYQTSIGCFVTVAFPSLTFLLFARLNQSFHLVKVLHDPVFALSTGSLDCAMSILIFGLFKVVYEQ